jgi:hypothetical protein
MGLSEAQETGARTVGGRGASLPDRGPVMFPEVLSRPEWFCELSSWSPPDRRQNAHRSRLTIVAAAAMSIIRVAAQRTVYPAYDEEEFCG